MARGSDAGLTLTQSSCACVGRPTSGDLQQSALAHCNQRSSVPVQNTDRTPRHQIGAASERRAGARGTRQGGSRHTPGGTREPPSKWGEEGGFGRRPIGGPAGDGVHRVLGASGERAWRSSPCHAITHHAGLIIAKNHAVVQGKAGLFALLSIHLSDECRGITRRQRGPLNARRAPGKPRGPSRTSLLIRQAERA